MKKYIPNTITSLNLISGCIATCMAFQGRLDWALFWIVMGAVFDFFDGMSARLLGVSSPIGKELDSLADDVTFGVAPATIIFSWLSCANYPSFIECLRPYLPFVAYIVAAFSALRLAKFNLDERQSLGFIGLPTPANALFWGSLIVGYRQYLDANCQWTLPLMFVLILFSSWILVSEIPMFALKFKHWGISYPGNALKYGFIIFSIIAMVATILWTGSPWAGFAPVILVYIILSIVTNRKA